MYSTIIDVKEVSIYVPEHACVPKMQLVKFIRLEIFKINEKNSECNREIKGGGTSQHPGYLKGKRRLVSNMTADFSH